MNLPVLTVIPLYSIIPIAFYSAKQQANSNSFDLHCAQSVVGFTATKVQGGGAMIRSLSVTRF